MSQTDLVCAKCVGRRTVNNIMMKVNSKVMVTTVAPDQPLVNTRRPIFVSASARKIGKKNLFSPDYVTMLLHSKQEFIWQHVRRSRSWTTRFGDAGAPDVITYMKLRTGVAWREIVSCWQRKWAANTRK
jgi:hypothetical protein